MFDNFVRARGIDEDDATWTREDWDAWRLLTQGTAVLVLTPKTSKEEEPSQTLATRR